jgi:hypothetical protein
VVEGRCTNLFPVEKGQNGCHNSEGKPALFDGEAYLIPVCHVLGTFIVCSVQYLLVIMFSLPSSIHCGPEEDIAGSLSVISQCLHLDPEDR